jgi:hypothetical protein
VLLDPGSAPVVVWPAVPGTQGLLTPILSVFPVPIEALLAPVPVFPESEVVAAMLVVCDDAGVCEAIAAVRLQAELAEGEVCANAAPDSAMPQASEAEKINRDMGSSKNSLARVASLTYLWRARG